MPLDRQIGSEHGVLGHAIIPAMQSIGRTEITDLEEIPNVGPAIAANMRRIGITSPRHLLGKDPYAMYDELCNATGVRHDPCVIDVFIAAVRFMAGNPARPWWKYTAARKRTLAARSGNGSTD